MNNKVVSYYDSLLYQSDVLLVEDGKWLNDKIIGFMFEFFHHDKFQEHSEVVAFVDPDVVQLIKLCPDHDAASIAASLDLHKKDLIFFPLNNNSEPLMSGGSHWSLLVFDIANMVVEHYDSCEGFHEEIAKETFQKISKIFCKTKNFSLRQVPIARQINSYDCGVYVIKITEETCRAKMRNEEWNGLNLKSSDITAYRLKIKELIRKFSRNSS